MDSGVLLGGVAMFVAWGIWGIAAKLAAQQIGMQALFWGQMVALAFLPAYFLVFRDMLPLKLDPPAVAWAVLAGALGVFGTMMLYVLLRAAPSSVVIPLSSLYPVVTVVLAFIFLHEELSIQRIAGILLALAAIWLLSS